MVQFDSELPTMPPYIIENKSHRTIRFWQKNVEKAATVVLPYKGAKYTWDDLAQERILVVECQPKETSSDHLDNSSGIILGAFSVDKIDEYKDLPVDKINVVVFPAGPTKVLRVIDKRIEDHNKNKDERNKVVCVTMGVYYKQNVGGKDNVCSIKRGNRIAIETAASSITPITTIDVLAVQIAVTRVEIMCCK